MIFISLDIYIELLCSGPRYGSIQCLFSTGKLCKFSKTLYNRQLIQFMRISVELVLRFMISKSRESNYIFRSCLVSAFDIAVRFMFMRSQSAILRAIHSMHFITVSLGYSIYFPGKFH